MVDKKTPQNFKMPEYQLEKPLAETVLYEKVTPEIARVTLNRPEKHNCLYAPDGFYELMKRLNMAADDEETKVVIVGGNGPSFCSGDDITRAPYEVFGGQPGVKPPLGRLLNGFRKIEGDLVRMLAYYPKILICELHGWVIGIGELISTCSDLNIAAEDTIISARVQRVAFAGFEPCWQLLHVLNIGLKRQRALSLTGRDIDAKTALDWGMVNAVVPVEQLKAETMRWAETVALMPADGLANSKAYYGLCLDALGVPTTITGGVISHTLMTNMTWRPNEFNYLKTKGQKGATEAFKERQARWAKLGF